MNSAQRRKQRRVLAPFIGEIQRAAALATRYQREKRELELRIGRMEFELDEAKRTCAQEITKLRESTDHEIRKLTENAKRAGPVLAEFHIALRHVAEAITGVPPQFRDDVADINQLRLKLLAALKGPK